MQTPRLTAGISLIELLVVITVMMTMMGIVGGVTERSIEKTGAQTELVALHSLIKKVSVDSFAAGRVAIIAFSGSNVEVVYEEHQAAVITYEYLFFSDQKITFNRNGFPNTQSLAVEVGGHSRVIDLHLDFKKVNYYGPK